jgi:hypothetical protein
LLLRCLSFSPRARAAPRSASAQRMRVSACRAIVDSSFDFTLIISFISLISPFQLSP